MTGHGGYSQQEFGKRKEPHRVIIARGDNVRSFTISPWVAGLGTAIGICLGLGYIGATAYLVLRDDIIQASAERQAEMQLSYEDRISSLRARIDQLTSRRVLERRSIAEQLEDVVTRQQDLGSRQEHVARVLARAAQSGIRVALGGPLPPSKPDIDAIKPSLSTAALDAPAIRDPRANIGGTPEPIEISPVLSLRGSQGDYGGAAAAAAAQAAGMPSKRLRDIAPETPAGKPDERAELLEGVSSALERMDGETNAALEVIAATAERNTRTITEAADKLGLKLAGKATASMGGPFVALGGVDFDTRLARAEAALETLATVKTAARGIPLEKPVPSAAITSSYGPRLDPFLGRMAMHTGIDFRAVTGTPVHAPAPGKVTFAGRNGGYGNSVEITHPSGVTTRFAHMSRIAVKEGDEVALNDTLGYVGTTGRSTGPHLHYEVRLDDRPLDPMPFVRAGTRLNPLLEH